MVDRESEAFKAAWLALWPNWLADDSQGANAMIMANRASFAAALEAYEAARPKLPTITGLPEALPDGTRIVAWAWRNAGHGEWWFAGGAFGLLQGPAFEARPVAITEADNG